MKLPANISSLEKLVSHVSAWMKDRGFPSARIQDIRLAVEEALVNIFDYAYPGGRGEVDVNCRDEAGNKYIIEIKDGGAPFDPTKAPEPEVRGGLQERKPGGLGIHLIKKMIGDVRYRREENENILMFVLGKE
jgi:anti-sigma regulatory factor (Ser/Thr protein kinase)